MLKHIQLKTDILLVFCGTWSKELAFIQQEENLEGIVLYRSEGVVIVAQCTATFQDLLCSPDYYFPASPISVANHQNRFTGKVIEALHNFFQKCDPVLTWKVNQFDMN